ncbi:MAG TPA: rhodanese-related sulfurtransferase [Devosia sp.]|nr:rhodanese-related sulfurtransferase [Devosia sp.]
MNTMPEQSGAFKVIAVYKFADLPDCAELQPQLEAFCRERTIRGTLILAPEGLNGTVAGSHQAIDELAHWLMHANIFKGRLRGAQTKFSFARNMPFLRLKVRLKPEIVTLRAPEADPSKTVGTYVQPKDWNQLIARQDVVVIDTRNDYEFAIGSFEGAIDPRTRKFTEFKRYVADNLDPARDKKIAMFCTGGIRCEKASAYMLAHGFEEVYHLDGGILNYLETVPAEHSRWRGECFVFDGRVSVGHGLVEGEAVLCRACRFPLTPEERAHPDFIEGVQCPHCSGEEYAKTRAAAAERQKQMELAEQRGMAHLGDDAASAARARAKAKKARREADRQQAG